MILALSLRNWNSAVMFTNTKAAITRNLCIFNSWLFKVMAIVTDRAGIEPRVARSTVQRLNHWAIKVPERPSRLRLAGSLHYSPLFEIRAPWLGPLSTKAGSFHSQANPGYRCHQCNGPCGYRTPGRSLHSPTPKPLGHKGTWTTQSLTLGWFVTPLPQSRNLLHKIR